MDKDYEQEANINNLLTLFSRGTDWYQEGLPDSIVTNTKERVFMQRLTPLTRKLMERWYAKQEAKRKALRERKRYTRRVGTVHPKKKEATRRRLLKSRWNDNPFGCVIHGYGAYSIDKALWERDIAPLWEEYNSEELKIKKYKRDACGVEWGTKAKPYTTYGFDVVHARLGVVYNGSSQELYDLSR